MMKGLLLIALLGMMLLCGIVAIGGGVDSPISGNDPAQWNTGAAHIEGPGPLLEWLVDVANSID